MLLELQQAVVAPLPQPFRLIHHHDGVVEIVQQGLGLGIEDVDQGFGAGEAAASQQRFDAPGKAPAQAGAQGVVGFARGGGLLRRRRWGILPLHQRQKTLVGHQPKLPFQLPLPVWLGSLGPLIPGAGRHHQLAQPFPRRHRFLPGQEHLRRREDFRRLPPGDGALGHHVEIPQGVDLVVEELQAQGVIAADGVYV